MLKKYFWNVLISIDQLGNTIIGGDPDETISSRSAKGVQEGVWGWTVLCKILHILDKGHCDKSIEKDEGKDGISNWKL